MSHLMRAVAFKPPGQITDLFISSSIPVPVPKPTECLIKVVYSALNRADIQQRRGLYPPPPGASEILGLEAVGRVVKCDNETESSWKPGDRVMCLLPGGGQAEFVTANQANLIRIPDWMSWRQAACIPEAWLTAFQLLYWVSNFTNVHGDFSERSVLVHAAASGVGTSLIQMLTRVLKVGAVYATVGSEDKRTYLEKNLNITKAINYKTENNFGEKILELTNQRGVDLVFDCVGGEYWEKNIACLAIDGEWVLYGLLGGGKVEGDFLARMMKKRLTLKTSTLRNRSIEYKDDLMRDFEKLILPHFENGLLEVIFDSEFELEKIADAHKRMESNQNIGKILLKIAEDSNESKHDSKNDL